MGPSSFFSGLIEDVRADSRAVKPSFCPMDQWPCPPCRLTGGRQTGHEAGLLFSSASGAKKKPICVVLALKMRVGEKN
jgi:hypothetical protein